MLARTSSQERITSTTLQSETRHSSPTIKAVSTLLLSNDTAFYVFKGILRQLAPPISVSPNMLSYPPKAVLPVDDS